MNVKTEMQKVSEETMRFMRGKYDLDEIPGLREPFYLLENNGVAA